MGAGQRKWFRHGAVTLLGVVVFSVGAEDYKQEQEELEALETELERLEEQLAADRSQRDEVEAELARLERKASEAARELARLRDQRDAARARVARLQAAYEAEAERLSQHRQTLAEQIVAAYTSAGEGALRLLLNQEDPATAQRLLVYHDYLNQARGERIEHALAELASLRQMRSELNAEIVELERLEDEVRAERQALEQRRAERDAQREALEARIAERGTERRDLEAEFAEQEELLEDLRERLADIPDDAAAEQAFAEARGELPWPVTGEVVEPFGASRGGGLKHTGIIVAAEAGDEVSAVAAGRVVFSDWLRGLGLLAIIDHGDGYLTLYGHNDALYVDVGEWVDAGQRVATVGSSGHRGDPGLYFEIRKGDEPQNPTAWLR
ncbi:MAG: murein hydrolase activator EnvC family protein [Halorhodospira sp.]